MGLKLNCQGFLLMEVVIGLGMIILLTQAIMVAENIIAITNHNLLKREANMIKIINTIQNDLIKLNGVSLNQIKLCKIESKGGDFYYLCQN